MGEARLWTSPRWKGWASFSGHSGELENGGHQRGGEYALYRAWVGLDARFGQKVCDVEVSALDRSHSDGSFVLDCGACVDLDPDVELRIGSARLGWSIAKGQELDGCCCLTGGSIEVSEKVPPKVALNDFWRRKVCLDVRTLDIRLCGDLARQANQGRDKQQNVFHDAQRLT